MSELSRLFAKPERINLDGIEIEIKPLTLEQLELFADLADAKKRTEAVREIIYQTLKQSIPDVTREEVNNLNLGHATVIMNAIMKVNGFEKMGKELGGLEGSFSGSGTSTITSRHTSDATQKKTP